MTTLFRANLTIRIRIQGCPESGLEALDYRRAHGLPDRLDDRHDVSILGEISEEDFRRLVAAGYRCTTHDDGSQKVYYAAIVEKYDPTYPPGCHCATIEVHAEDTPVDLACRALVACRREQREDEIGAPELRRELEQIEERAGAIREQLAAAAAD